MAFSNLGLARESIAPARARVRLARWQGLLAAAVPFALILLWTAVVRLPFYGFADGDEFFYSVVAEGWLHGSLPYVDAFDVKPPGVFFIFAMAQALFGASYATIKGLEIVAVAAGAAALFAMLRPFGSRLALWAAALFPVYTLAFDGMSAANMLLQLPFLIAAFGLVLAAVRNDATTQRRLAAAVLAGLAMGMAGMVKQTAVFEATAALVALAAYGPPGIRARLLGLFLVGAALPALAFSAYYFALGHLDEMLNAVVVLAMQRLDPAVLASYGPEHAYYLTLPGVLENTLATSIATVFLWGGAMFTLLRREQIKSSLPSRLLVVPTLWLLASLASVVFGRMLCSYYLLATVPPLLILAGAFFCYGMHVAPRRRVLAFWLSIFAAVVALTGAHYRQLLSPNLWSVDRLMATRAATALTSLGLKPDDRLLVLNRGLDLYTETGARPPTPYFHNTHLLSIFQTPSPDPLGEALATNPRFIVLADPSIRRLTELPERLARAKQYLAAHYHAAAVVQGGWDSLTIYEYSGS